MEPSVENDLNETINEFNKVSIEDVHTRHRKERKELQSKIQALKKNAPKSDKKKRKEVLDEIAKLESDLNKKQEEEIKQAENEINCDQQKFAQEETSNVNQNNLTNDFCNEKNDIQLSQQRVTKAQKRRDKKAREAREKEAEIKAELKKAKNTPKAVETRKLKSKLKDLELALFNIPSDGDCLYNAIRHQLLQNGLVILTTKELRNETADYIQTNKDSLIHYMTNPKTGELLTDEEFEKYCDEIRQSSWGGQVELKALSSILEVPIKVLQADCSPTVHGAEFGGAPLVITYHRHMFSLGEHYNSTFPLAEAFNDDDSMENSDN